MPITLKDSNNHSFGNVAMLTIYVITGYLPFSTYLYLEPSQE